MTTKRATDTLNITEQIMDKVGTEAFAEGVMPRVNLWTNDTQVIERDCPVCGAIFVGPRTEVYAALAQHDFGHRKDEERALNLLLMGGA